MGLFSNLMSKIFPGSAKAVYRPLETAPGATSAGTSGPASPPAAAGPAAGTPAGSPAPAAAPPPTVDVTAILDALAAKNPEKLDWRRSIVDLMKLVDMDSSFKARKELAAELKYSGDPNDSAKMNIWLHKEVIRQMAANGGKVPSELLD